MKLPFRNRSPKKSDADSLDGVHAKFADDSDAEIEECTSLDDIFEMSPTEFELFVLSTMRELGYRDLTLTPRTGDLGVDILGKNKRGKTTAVQCKRFQPTSKVTSPMLMTFIGMAMVHHKAEVCLYVTTGGYTKEAVSLANKHKIELIDGPRLASIHCKQTSTHVPKRGRRGLRR